MTPLSLTLPKRSAFMGQRYGVAETFPKAFSTAMFRAGVRTRAFELCAAEAYDAKKIPVPIYLCLGQEFNSAALSCVADDMQIFAQHRAHGIYLAYGGEPEALRDELLGLPSGCAKGMAGSNAIHCPAINMYGHSGLMGEQVSIAVGAALASNKPTLTIFGDASAEEDYIYPALGLAASRKLPVLFICEDNGLSILTPVSTRRTWSVTTLAASLGIPSVDIADDPWLIASEVQTKVLCGLPALITIHTCRDVWHAGTGKDGAPEWDRFSMVLQQMRDLDLEQEATQALCDAYAWAKGLWTY